MVKESKVAAVDNDVVDNNLYENKAIENRSWFYRVLVLERKNRMSLSQMASSLKAETEILSKSKTNHDISEKEALLSEITSQLKNINTESDSPESWNDVYYIEQLVTSLYGKSRIAVELDRRIHEAKRQNAPFTEFYVAKHASIQSARTLHLQGVDANEPSGLSTGTVQSDDDERQLLLSLVKDLQWFYQQQNLKRQYSRDAMYRVCIVFAVSFSVFILALLSSIVKTTAS